MTVARRVPAAVMRSMSKPARHTHADTSHSACSTLVSTHYTIHTRTQYTPQKEAQHTHRSVLGSGLSLMGCAMRRTGHFGCTNSGEQHGFQQVQKLDTDELGNARPFNHFLFTKNRWPKMIQKVDHFWFRALWPQLRQLSRHDFQRHLTTSSTCTCAHSTT